jgi:hypothetical protein
LLFANNQELLLEMGMPPNAQPNYIHSTPPVIQVEEATQISFLFKRVVYLCIIEKKKKRLLYITYTYSSVPKLLSLIRLTINSKEKRRSISFLMLTVLLNITVLINQQRVHTQRQRAAKSSPCRAAAQWPQYAPSYNTKAFRLGLSKNHVFCGFSTGADRRRIQSSLNPKLELAPVQRLICAMPNCSMKGEMRQ